MLLNLIGWRALLRRRRLRYWCLLLAGGQLVALVGIFSLRIENAVQPRQFWLESEAALQGALTERLKIITSLVAEIQQREEAVRLRADRLEENLHWEQRLLRLGAAIPAAVWLTEMHFSNGLLSVDGRAIDPAALAVFEDETWMSPGFGNVLPGAVTRDSQEQLIFSLAWRLEGRNVPAH